MFLLDNEVASVFATLVNFSCASVLGCRGAWEVAGSTASLGACTFGKVVSVGGNGVTLGGKTGLTDVRRSRQPTMATRDLHFGLYDGQKYLT